MRAGHCKCSNVSSLGNNIEPLSRPFGLNTSGHSGFEERPVYLKISFGINANVLECYYGAHNF